MKHLDGFLDDIGMVLSTTRRIDVVTVLSSLPSWASSLAGIEGVLPTILRSGPYRLYFASVGQVLVGAGRIGA
jgi:hypothetical protein